MGIHWHAMAVRRPPALDRIDIKILAALQRDGRTTVQKLAGLVGLTPRPCLERVRRLETAGIIAGYRAVIAVERLSKRWNRIFAEIALEKPPGRTGWRNACTRSTRWSNAGR